MYNRFGRLHLHFDVDPPGTKRRRRSTIQLPTDRAEGAASRQSLILPNSEFEVADYFGRQGRWRVRRSRAATLFGLKTGGLLFYTGVNTESRGRRIFSQRRFHGRKFQRYLGRQCVGVLTQRCRKSDGADAAKERGGTTLRLWSSARTARSPGARIKIPMAPGGRQSTITMRPVNGSAQPQ